MRSMSWFSACALLWVSACSDGVPLDFESYELDDASGGSDSEAPIYPSYSTYKASGMLFQASVDNENAYRVVVPKASSKRCYLELIYLKEKLDVFLRCADADYCQTVKEPSGNPFKFFLNEEYRGMAKWDVGPYYLYPCGVKPPTEDPEKEPPSGQISQRIAYSIAPERGKTVPPFPLPERQPGQF